MLDTSLELCCWYSPPPTSPIVPVSGSWCRCQVAHLPLSYWPIGSQYCSMRPIRGLDWPSSDRDQALHHRPGVTVNTWLAHNYHYTLARQIWGVPASENEPGCIIMLTFTEMHLSPAHWTPDFDRPTYFSLTGFISMCLIQFRASFVYPSILILTPITLVQPGHDHDALLTAGEMSGPALGPDWSSDRHLSAQSALTLCSLLSLLSISQWPEPSSLCSFTQRCRLKSLFCVLIWECFCKRFDPTFTVTLLDTWQRCPSPGCALCQ